MNEGHATINGCRSFRRVYYLIHVPSMSSINLSFNFLEKQTKITEFDHTEQTYK